MPCRLLRPARVRTNAPHNGRCRRDVRVWHSHWGCAPGLPIRRGTFLVFPDILFDFHLLVFRVSLTYFEYCPKVRDQNVGAMIHKKRDMAKQVGTQSPSGTPRTQAASAEKRADTAAKMTEYRDRKDKPADRRYRTAIRKNGRCDHSSWQATARTATRNSQPALNRQRSDLCTKKSKALPAVCRSPQKKS